MSNNLSRRLKRVAFDRKSLYGGVNAVSTLRQIADRLPADAQLVYFAESCETAQLFMTFWSASWDEVPEGERVPELRVEFRDDYESRRYVIPAGTPIKQSMFLPGAVNYVPPADPSRRLPFPAPSNPACACDIDYTGVHRGDCPLRNRRR